MPRMMATMTAVANLALGCCQHSDELQPDEQHSKLRLRAAQSLPRLSPLCHRPPNSLLLIKLWPLIVAMVATTLMRHRIHGRGVRLLPLWCKPHGAAMPPDGAFAQRCVHCSDFVMHDLACWQTCI